MSTLFFQLNWYLTKNLKKTILPQLKIFDLYLFQVVKINYDDLKGIITKYLQLIWSVMGNVSFDFHIFKILIHKKRTPYQIISPATKQEVFINKCIIFLKNFIFKSTSWGHHSNPLALFISKNFNFWYYQLIDEICRGALMTGSVSFK